MGNGDARCQALPGPGLSAQGPPVADEGDALLSPWSGCLSRLPDAEHTYPQPLQPHPRLFTGWIRASGWIWGTMVHKTHPEARIHPVVNGADRLRMSSRTGRHQHHARGPDISEESPFWGGGMDNEQAFPVIRQTVLDTTDPRRLAEFLPTGDRGRRERPGVPNT